MQVSSESGYIFGPAGLGRRRTPNVTFSGLL